MTTKLLNSLAAATTLAGMMVTAGVANAASLTRTVSTDFALTNIVDSVLSIEKFDSSLGTLNSVYLDFTSNLTGSAGFENRGAGASTIKIKLGANVELKQLNLDLSSSFPITLTSEELYSVSSFDGVFDWNGTSGMTVTGLTATQSATKMFTDLSDLAVFTGTGNLDFLFSALAHSNVTGSGNMASFVDTLAKASLSVTYNYDDLKTVPEPSALLGIGLFAGIGLLSQRKKSWFKISYS
ncbi:choice-of-anchor E domain-containing protein [Anabaena sp. CCY 0017]|uniref:choice-of-anchor E domain-containing protein n=1 Tax=Anabaena sp. CCY 0017 TaxID=3103866 RepID=UPI0039C657CF